MNINNIENLIDATNKIKECFPNPTPENFFHRRSLALGWGLDMDDDGNVIPQPDPEMWVRRDPEQEDKFAAPCNYYNAFMQNLPPEAIEKIKKVKISYEYGFEVAFHGPDARAQTSHENGTLGGRPRLDNPSPHTLAQRAYLERKNNLTVSNSTDGDSPFNERGGTAQP